MKHYYIQQVASPMEWDKIPYLEVDQIHWLPDTGARMMQQICYDDSALYIRQFAVEHNIRAEHISPLSQVCEDSCMEFFFCPDPSNNRYFNFELNPNGCLYLGLFKNRESYARLLPPNAQKLFNIRTERTHNGWTVSYQIPLSFIQLFFPDFHLAPGQSFRANCYKCGDRTDHPHYLAWNPCSSENPDFHRPVDFGLMTLGG